MNRIRVIPRLDVKGPYVVKGINFEGLRKVGKPSDLARRYYEQGADDLLYIDIVASLYERNNLVDVVEETSSVGVFIPITVGGGVRKIEDIRELLFAGADKVAINTAATRNPKFITEASKLVGSQSIVGSIEAKEIGPNKWEAYIDCGREKTGLDAVEWAKELVELGAGELLITSVDHEGEQRGYDINLFKAITKEVSVPIVVSGGAGNLMHIKECLDEITCDGISMASVLHYNKLTIGEIKEFLKQNSFNVRTISQTKIRVKPKENAKRKRVGIVDYGAGNIRSVFNGFIRVGNPVNIVNTPEEIEESELLVIPGVGAFNDGMKGLKKRKLINPIIEHVNNNKPILGICLGMQLLMSDSEEFGFNEGLSIKLNKTHEWDGSILKNIPDFSDVYFVHSFYPIIEEKELIQAETIYGNQKFCSSFRKNNVYGTQFHPEKSGEIGLQILDNFGHL